MKITVIGPGAMGSIYGMVPVVTAEVGLKAPGNDTLSQILRPRATCRTPGSGPTSGENS